jgi:hypothetical protein
MTMAVNSIGSHADTTADTVVAQLQVPQGIKFSAYIQDLAHFAKIDTATATALANELDDVSDLIATDPTIATDVAATLGIDTKTFAYAFKVVAAKHAKSTISSPFVSPNWSVTQNSLAPQQPISPAPIAPPIINMPQAPQQTIAEIQAQMAWLANQLSAQGITVDYTLASAAPTYTETAEQQLARLIKDKEKLEAKVENIEMIHPGNVVTTLKSAYRESRLRKSIRKGNNERVLQKQFGYPIIRLMKDLDPTELEVKMHWFEQQYGPAKRANLPVKARRRVEKMYKYVTTAYTAYTANQKAFPTS